MNIHLLSTPACLGFPHSFGLRIPPREGHRLAERFFVRRLEDDPCTTLPSPGATLRRERVRRLSDEACLLVRRQDHHSVFAVAAQRRKDPSIRTKVRMSHMRALDGAFHSERDSAELVF